MSWTNTLFRFIVNGFRPPFRTTHWMVLLYVVLSIFYNPNSHFHNWTMPDTDDYTRFVQVFNWLDGQSWFDMRLPQIYPQHVISMHWARLVDIPLAGFIIAFEWIAHLLKMTPPRSGVAMLVAFVVPCIILFCFLKLIRAIARPMVGRGFAGFACFIVPLSIQLVFQYLPMRVDHHAYILMGAGVSFFALQAMVLGVKPWRMSMLAGLAIGIAMWNGAEILPMLLGFGFCITLLMILSRRPAFIHGVIFGASLLLTTFLVLLAAKAPADRWAMDYDSFSFFYVMIAFYTLAFFTTLFICSRITKNTAVLLAFAIFASFVDLDAFLIQFPDFIAGPYAKVNPLLNQVFFPNIREAIPFFDSWLKLGDNFASTPNQAIGAAIYYMTTRLFAPTIAVITSIYQLFKPRISQRVRSVWLLYTFFTVFFTGLAMFWEVRLITYAQMLSIVPMVWLMLTYLKKLPLHYTGRQLYGWEILVVLSFTLLPTVIIPGIIQGSKLNPDMMFYLGNSTPMPCKDRTKVTSFLRDLHDDEHVTATIMAQMDYTPEFMFFTPHHFIAAPYHRNDRGLTDMVLFFRSKSDDYAARNIAKKLALDYVLVCKAAYYQSTLTSETGIKNFVVNVSMKNIEAKPNEKELLETSLAVRISNDKIPSWLEPVPIPLESDFALFKVNQKLLDKPSSYPKTAAK
ncbi:MAG: hypothetical protein K2Q32_03595 [Alphaproteobacteria bacterium]|nr:hypothetical protein [Alphaproteobacteria bacterium]